MWGDDFAHLDAEMTYLWLDTLIADIREYQDLPSDKKTDLIPEAVEGVKYKLLKSTISEFFDNVFTDAKEN